MYREKGHKMSDRFKRYSFNYFFRINNKTKEKVDLFNKMFNSNFT